MTPRWVICRSCGRHVKAGDRACPHCDAGLSRLDSVRAPERRSVAVGRVVLATAVTGIGAGACGGHVMGQDAPSQADILGSCPASLPSGGYTSCVDTSISCNCTQAAGCTCTSPPANLCACGRFGECSGGSCVPQDCGSDSYLSSTGCKPTYWFEGKLPPTATCYGCPPLLA
ncbi:MAG TPA: hypothetical protein VKU41_23040 [Polyangiaceae bacterium]|nr:hypothetical protein [Polyangiaceae bacterium]